MKEINGKKYYISLSYLSKESEENGWEAKDLEHIFIKPANQDIALYTSEDIYIPLFPVNDIQFKNKDRKFDFSVIVNPSKDKVEFGNEFMKKFNTVGLFSEYKKDGVQYLGLVSFFKVYTNLIQNVPNADPIALKIIVDENLILKEE